MKKFLPFSTKIDAQAFVDLTNENMGYPNKNGTDSYTKYVKHPTESKWGVLTCLECHPIMSQEQIDSLQMAKEFFGDALSPDVEIAQ